jgi:hypothetical protein
MEWYYQIGTSTTTSADSDTRMAPTTVLPNAIRVTVGLTAILCVDNVSTLPREVGMSLPTSPLDLQVRCVFVHRASSSQLWVFGRCAFVAPPWIAP